MNFHRIASRIARIETVSDSAALTNLISDDIKAQFKIPSSSKPFSSGSESSVFENSEGNIVAFIENSSACESAYKSVGRNLTTVPEVYDLDTILLTEINEHSSWEWKTKVCVIVMEKLRPLSHSEQACFKEFYDGDHDEFNELENEDKLDTLEHVGKSITDLHERMEKENIDHRDFHSGNVAWGHDGKLKLIDWEPIFIGG